MATITDAADLARNGADVVVVATTHDRARDMLDTIARADGVVRVSFANGLEGVTFASGGRVRFTSRMAGLSADHVFVPNDRQDPGALGYLLAAGGRVHDIAFG